MVSPGVWESGQRVKKAQWLETPLPSQGSLMTQALPYNQALAPGTAPSISVHTHTHQEQQPTEKGE